ncbi:hypothetical protein CDEST_00740 [Colletotrichum destructivum]|uniref:Uncharacterized protein n=1 Tax=Colletotrichum destructivum TaxID=34406 RepID=A0AAX4HX35_9PEZI|nr:hypothetical protein CDEST_00740 [Colletotrichum destructivum]
MLFECVTFIVEVKACVIYLLSHLFPPAGPGLGLGPGKKVFSLSVDAMIHSVQLSHCLAFYLERRPHSKLKKKTFVPQSHTPAVSDRSHIEPSSFSHSPASYDAGC